MKRLAFLLAPAAFLSIGCASEGPVGQKGTALPSALPAPPGTLSAGPSAPVAIRIPKIGVDGRDIIPLGMNKDRSMAVPPLSKPLQGSYYCPEKPGKCGWPTPGEKGGAIVTAHVNANHKPGLFARLGELNPGDRVEVERADGQVAVFTVTAKDEPKKKAFPQAAVFNDVPDSQIRLITCGGGDNTLERLPNGQMSYTNNTIIFGRLLELKPKAA